MDDPQIERMAEKIRSSGRRRRPGGRWSDPATPLQAARFEARKSGKEVIAAIRAICKGHAPGRPCRIGVAKLSDFERGDRRPCLEHIEAFCRYYGKSPEALGLINWRDEPADPDPAAGDHPADDQDLTHEQLLRDWLSDSVTAVTAAVLQALARCPITLTQPELHHHDDHRNEEPPGPPSAPTEPREHR